MTDSLRKNAIFNLLLLCLRVVAACLAYLRKFPYIYLCWNKKIPYLFHSVSLCTCRCKHTHSCCFDSEVRMFHCFDKANCHTGTAEIYNCKSLSSSRSYNNNNYQKIYIAVCERRGNKENLERFGFCFCIGFFFGSMLKANKRTKNPTEIIIQKTLWTSYTTVINNGYNLNSFIPRKSLVLNIR